MKKAFKSLFITLATVAACFGFVFALASCSSSKVSKEYADQINSSYTAGTAITYEDAKNALGSECIDVTTGNGTAGLLVAVKGVSNENYREKLNNQDPNTKYDFIAITVVQGKCTYALFANGTASEVNTSLIGK